MGDSIGDILYIFVMVAALIFSIYKKAKGSAHDETVMPEHEANESPGEFFPPLSDWLSDDDQPDGEKQKPEKSQVVPMQAEKLKPEKLQYKKPEYKSIQKKERPKTKKPDRIKRIPYRPVRMGLAQEKITQDASHWDDESFDLQKAIIFSEIIKRPTF